MNPVAASLGLKTISPELEGKIQMPAFDYRKLSNSGLKGREKWASIWNKLTLETGFYS